RAAAAASDSARRAAVPGAAEADSLARAGAAARSPGPLLDYIWVLRTAINTPPEVARVVERAHEMGVRGLLVQVVARGDAFYRSDVLPRAESLVDSTFDPLGALLPLAHAAGLEVHAWMNCAVVWSGPRPPRDPRHVLNAHPEWVVRVPGGRPMSALSLEQRRRLKLEGVFLSPAHRGMRTWVARVAREIAGRYAVDGIHLDYIREPGVSLASDPMMRASFVWRTGLDPERFDRLPPERRAWADSAWTALQVEQVTAIVREVRDSLERVRPGLPLSAAVLPDTVLARQRGQAWTDWVRDGLIDRVFVMCYAPVVRTVHQEMLGYASELGTDGRVVPGIAVYNSPPSHAAAKIRAAAAIGYPTLALYSYDSLYARRGYWTALCRQLEPGQAGGAAAAAGPRGKKDPWTRP
ncbi:MAG TPA: family 10 glycosylhydrolase, partial [Candidatus Eisenbacteria bacterium]